MADNFSILDSDGVEVLIAATERTIDGETVKTQMIEGYPSAPSAVKAALTASQTAAVLVDAGTATLRLLRLVIRCSAAGDVYAFLGTDAAANAVGPALSMAAGETFELAWPRDCPRDGAAAADDLCYTSGSGFAGSAYVEYDSVS